MSTMHTPGPWRWMEGDTGISVRMQSGYGGEWIVPVPYALPRDISQIRANAALIAASPDLFAALTELLDFAESPEADYSAPHEYEAVREDAIKRARAALAKAVSQ